MGSRPAASGFASRAGALLALLACAACATPVHNVPASYQPGSSAESVVIGQVMFDLAQLHSPPNNFFLGLSHPSLVVRNETTREDYEIVLDEGGLEPRFWVALPPGSYSLVKLTVREFSAEPGGRFAVPGGGIVYVGTLRFEQDKSPGAIVTGVLTGSYAGHWVVVDEGEDAVPALRRNFGGTDTPVTKSLIVLPR